MNQLLLIEDDWAHLVGMWDIGAFWIDARLTYRYRWVNWSREGYQVIFLTWDTPYPDRDPARRCEDLMGARHQGGEYIDGSLPEDHIAAQQAYARPPWWDKEYQHPKPGNYRDPRNPWNQ